MADIGQSVFLQALGWATIASMGQMGLLWGLFLIANRLFSLTASSKYILSVLALALGIVFFGFSIYYYPSGLSSLSFVAGPFSSSSFNGQWCLAAASLTYLLLFFIPASRLWAHWRFAHALKAIGLHKAQAAYQLFVHTMAAQLGIKKEVQLFLSGKATSPLMVGFLKPVILLPLACISQLSPDQVEAILLHELVHIRRYDYLVNILMQLVRTVLYFNPFVQYFMRTAEVERENCCDERVLQFGYDKARYASALLVLEKSMVQSPSFAIGAAGKKPLISRIEKIAGIQKKPVFPFYQFASVPLAFLLFMVVHTFVLTHRVKKQEALSTIDHFPVGTFNVIKEETKEKVPPSTSDKRIIITTEVKVTAFLPGKTEANNPEAKREIEKIPAYPSVPSAPFIPVSAMEADAALTSAEKEQVKATIEATQKVLLSAQWKEVDKAIADGMTKGEKERAQQQYLQEINSIDWKNVENGLKADYDKIDWEKVATYLSTALVTVQLDSMKNYYQSMLTLMEKAERKDTLSITVLPYPDLSVDEWNHQKKELQHRIFIIEEVQLRKRIKL